jgi:hypothetical protein
MLGGYCPGARSPSSAARARRGCRDMTSSGRRALVDPDEDPSLVLANADEHDAVVVGATILKRMFSLGIKAGKVATRPHFDMLQENNVRTGFFESEQFRAVLRHLPEDLRTADMALPVVNVAAGLDGATRGAVAASSRGEPSTPP